MDQQKRQQLRDIVRAELSKGKSPDEVFQLAVAAGAPKEVVIEEMEMINAGGGGFSFLPLLGPFLKKKEKKEEVIEKSNSFWDPIGEIISSDRFKISSEKIQSKFEEYTKNPNLPQRNLFFFSMPAIFTIFLVSLYPRIFEALANISNDGGGITFLFLPFLPIVWYYRTVHKLQQDLVKMMIADDHKWVYCPNERGNRWINMSNAYPELFKKGNKNQNFQDEFWGNFEGIRQKVDFWTGIFEYTTESGSGKNRHSVTRQKTAVALRLNKKLSSDFRLEPNGAGSKFLNFFRRDKNIKTESSDFNKSFAVFYNGKKIEKQLEIVKTLSPSVQVRLLEVFQKAGKFSLQFRNETVIFVFEEKLFKKMKTNFFFKGAKIDPRDQKAIEDWLNSMLDMSSDIIPFLD